jgi:alpha,alpha-trehalase
MANEFEYWMQNHLVTVVKDGAAHTLARYNCEEAGPRPESYREDYELVEGLDLSPGEKEKMYIEIKTGAETGWDFSTRWMVKPAAVCKEANANERFSSQSDSFGVELKDTKSRFIIPVDLNAFLAANARKLSQYYRDIFRDFEAAAKYEHIAQNLCEAMDAVLWNCRDGIWYDYDLINDAPRVAFFPSNLAPLWAECFSSESKRAEQTRQAVDYLHHFLTREDGCEAFAGGVPTSLNISGQQWDFPNCWPPLEHLLVMGLERTNINKAKELAFRIARSRIRGALANFKSRGHMFEKVLSRHVHV